jgi:hypothetical protein
MKRWFIISFFAFSGIILLWDVYVYSLMLDHTDPLDTADTLNSLFRYQRYLVPFLFLILIVQSNRIARQYRSANYFMISALFFVFFTLADYIFLGEVYWDYRQDTGLWQGEFSVLGFAGLVFSLLAVLLSWLNFVIANFKGKRKKHASFHDPN